MGTPPSPLFRREPRMEWVEFQRASNELYREFPVCVGELVPAENKTATTRKEEPGK